MRVAIYRGGQMIIVDFCCKQDHVFESFVSRETQQLDCPHCGTVAKRIVSAPRFVLDGCSGDFPTASDQWVKRREEKMALERKVAK